MRMKTMPLARTCSSYILLHELFPRTVHLGGKFQRSESSGQGCFQVSTLSSSTLSVLNSLVVSSLIATQFREKMSVLRQCGNCWVDKYLHR